MSVHSLLGAVITSLSFTVTSLYVVELLLYNNASKQAHTMSTLPPRSLPGQQTLGPREQINQNTAFLDASHIYGQELCEARELRAEQTGYLNVTRHPIRGKPLLPQVQEGHLGLVLPVVSFPFPVSLTLTLSISLSCMC